MQREIRRPPQAKRGLYLFRFHAKSKLRYRRPQSDAGRAKADRRAICRLSRKSAASKHRGGLCRETTAIAAGLVNERERTRDACDRQHRQAADSCKRPPARQTNQLSAAYLLVRVAAAFRRHQGPEKGAVRIFVEQGQAKLTLPSSGPSFPKPPPESARPSVAASLVSPPRHP